MSAVLWTFLIVFFIVQTCLSTFPFHVFFGVVSNDECVTSPKVTWGFHLYSCTFLGLFEFSILWFRFVINHWIILVFSVRVQIHYSVCWYSVAWEPFVEKTILCLPNCLGTFSIPVGFISRFSVLFHWSSHCQSHTVFITSALCGWFKLRECKASNLVLFQVCFSSSPSPKFPYAF